MVQNNVVIYSPIDWCTFMVSKSKETFLTGQVFFKKVRNCLQNEKLVTARLIPYIVGGKVSSHVYPVKLGNKN